MIAWIRVASTEQLLRKWRYAPAGDAFLVGAAGFYFAAELARVQVEDRVGWYKATESISWDFCT